MIHSPDAMVWLSIGVLLGVVLFLVTVFFFGRSGYRELMKNDRVITSRPIPRPFPKDMVVAYKRRHRRHHSDGGRDIAAEFVLALLFALGLAAGVFYLAVAR